MQVTSASTAIKILPYKNKADKVNGHDRREPILFFNRMLDYQSLLATKKKIDMNEYSNQDTRKRANALVMDSKQTVLVNYTKTNILELAARHQKAVKRSNAIWGVCLTVLGAATAVLSSSPVAAIIGVPAILASAPAFIPVVGVAVTVVGVTLLAMGIFVTPKKTVVSDFKEITNGSGK